MAQVLSRALALPAIAAIAVIGATHWPAVAQTRVPQKSLAPAIGPDLVIESAHLIEHGPDGANTTNSIGADRAALVSLQIKNAGNRDAVFPQGATLWLVTGGPAAVARAGNAFTGTVQPGQTLGGGVIIIDPWDLAPGTYAIELTVDPRNAVTERNETNNKFDLKFSVIQRPGTTGKPDLSVTVVGLEPAPSHPNDTRAKLKARLANVGGSDAYFPSNAQVIHGSPKFGAVTNDTGGFWIKRGATKDLLLPMWVGCPLPAQITANLVIDPWNLVSESNESNNTVPIAVNVSTPPAASNLSDLVVAGVTFTPANPSVQDRIMVHVEMRNLGPGVAHLCGTNWRASKPGGGGVGGAGYREVPSGQTFFGGVYMFDAGELAAGCHAIKAAVDPDGHVQEVNEGNNEMTVNLSVGGVACRRTLLSPLPAASKPIPIPIPTQ